MARIGLLGGSFDPIHRAHLELACRAADELGLQQVWLIPAGRPWQRGELAASASQREDMTRLAAAADPRLRVLDLELRREGPTYTIDTLRELQASQPECEFVLILGSDQLENLPSWKDWRQIAARVDLAVAQRPAHRARAASEVLQALRAGGHTLHLLRMPPAEVSATEVRERAARRRDLRDLVPAAVADYIERHHLYQDPCPPNGHT